MGTRSFLGGVAVGAGLMYLLDPEHGAERRLAAQRHFDELRAAGAPVRLRRGDIAGFRAHDARSGRVAPGRIRTSSAVVGVAGGAMAAYGLARRGRVGGMMRKVGATMLVAGIKDLEAGPLGLLRERRRAADAHATIVVAAPPSVAFAFWRDYENFPLIMPHVKDVTDLGGDRSRWTVDGPGGVPVEWTARLTQLVPDQLLAWTSEPGSAVENSGMVRFTPEGGGTRVDVRISYAPVAGGRGKAIAGLLGADPASRLGADLARVKALLDLEGRRSHG